jgi:hypothetical protein
MVTFALGPPAEGHVVAPRRQPGALDDQPHRLPPPRLELGTVPRAERGRDARVLGDGPQQHGVGVVARVGDVDDEVGLRIPRGLHARGVNVDPRPEGPVPGEDDVPGLLHHRRQGELDRGGHAHGRVGGPQRRVVPPAPVGREDGEVERPVVARHRELVGPEVSGNPLALVDQQLDARTPHEG